MHSISMPPDALNPILIWQFYDAPEHYRSLSTHGGDEDGVVFIPKGVEEPYWLEQLWCRYGDPDRVELPDGSGTVIIWAHG